MKLRMFEDKNFWKSMLRLALPIAFQNLLTTSLSLVDTLMIGQLGDVSIAAVGIASQVAFFVNEHSDVWNSVGRGGIYSPVLGARRP